ncbi:hypothetical protein [Pseudomonas moraviensis]|jgi:hypothetical protein|uniref:Uncharacterized protein n=1 Tax=Pseudomonas moraviensis R28-S TaxID=1395516 RepID=V8R5S2_9PSED|nr:hypothetical protein [Pseudomonas moraviensis]ETF06915.1 hypothetical protein PMO01_17455 [Pseudomonas moraviensis R28-S]
MSEENVLILQLPVERDEDGFWTHPAWPSDGEEDAIPKSWFGDSGLELFIVDMESDGPEGLFETWADEGLCDCSPWVPSAPAGEGWFIFSIHDTEDGPICVWVRHLPGLKQEIDALSAGREFCGACGDGCESCRVAEGCPK